MQLPLMHLGHSSYLFAAQWLDRKGAGLEKYSLGA